MLTTVLPSATTLATAATSPASVLRLHGGTEDERLIPIPVGKWSIGSGPRCSIRLAYPGVQPLHCLITCDDQGLRVRRWADHVLLNGVPFDEASLASGDRLTIGSIELEVVGESSEADAAASPIDAPWRATETDAALDAVQDNVSEMIGGSDETSALPPNTPVDSAPAPTGASVAPNRLTRTRRRKLLAALRFHHQMGLQLERAVSRIEQQMCEISAGQADSTAEGAHLTGTLATLVDQVREYRSEQASLEQQHADWLEQSRGWESRLEEQQHRLQTFEREANRGRELGDNMHRRGRKLVASLRKGRESFRALDDRLAGLEQKSQESLAEQERLRDEMTKVLEQQGAQETQAVAWNAVIEATDRLSNNYRQLVAENSRLAGEIEKFSAARGELAAEKAAASELLAMLREQLKENQQRQGEFDLQRGQWQDVLHSWESRVIARDEWADRFERELKGIRASFDAPAIPIAEWKSLSEHVASLTSQQSEWEQRRNVWQGRIEQCETRFADFGRQLATVERQMADVQTATSEPPIASAEWTALSEQVVSLRDQQAEWEQRRDAWQSRVEVCESQFGELRQHISDTEQSISALQAANSEPTISVVAWTALTEQVASLRTEQANLAQQRTAWEARLSEWETQLASGSQQFGDLASEVEGLRSAHRDQTTLVAQLASPQRVGRQAEEPVPQVAIECDPSEHGLREPAIADREWERDDVAEQPAASSATSAMAPSDEVAVTEPVVEPEPVRAAPPAPVSYLEKYAHIFEDDDAAGPGESLQPPPRESPFANRTETYQPDPAAEEPSASLGDEESVEQYMAKMMTRIRGDLPGNRASSISSPVEPSGIAAPPAATQSIDAAEPVAASPNDPGSMVAIVDEVTGVPLLNDIEEMKPKTPAPVFAADMTALRALANHSARHAIGVHTARRLRRTALRRCVVAVLAIFAGLCLFIFSPGWQSPQFVGACVAMIAALYLTWLSYDSLTQAIRVGAFQHFDDDGEDPVHPPLPIDVDRSRVDR